MFKFTNLALAFALAIGSIASLPRVCAEGSDRILPTANQAESTCGDHYNELLTKARAALTQGDRARAVTSLLAAKAQLRECQEREERNSIAPVAVAMNCRYKAPARW
jgi:hypothetical protein